MIFVFLIVKLSLTIDALLVNTQYAICYNASMLNHEAEALRQATIQSYLDPDVVAEYADTYGATVDADLAYILPHLGRGSVIVDAGSGSGTGTQWLAEKGMRVLGIDISPAMIERAEAIRTQPNNPTYVCGDITDIRRLTQEAGISPDAVVCVSTLHHLMPYEIEDFVQSVHGLLPQKGILYVSSSGPQSGEHHNEYVRYVSRRNADNIRGFTRLGLHEFETTLEEAGFESWREPSVLPERDGIPPWHTFFMRKR